MELPIGQLIGILITIFILFILSAIYSGCETAYSSFSGVKIHEMLENKEKSSKLIERHHKRYNRILTTILIGNNLVNVATSTITAYLISKVIYEERIAIIVSTAVVTPLLVLFGEITPKLIAKQYPKQYLQCFGWYIDLNYWIFWILTWPITKLSKKVYVTNSEDDLKTIINLAQKEGVLQTGESILAQKALDLDSTKVSSHYIKLKDVTSIKFKANIQEALDIFKETNYSRLPIEKDGQLIGILLLKDIFYLKRGKIINYMKLVPTVSANSILSSALEKMRSARAQMAFVTENNNGSEIIGIITIEDIVEEIIGEIYDEYDDEEKIYEISLEKSRVEDDVIMWDLFKQLEIDESLLEDSEEDLSLAKFLILKTKKTKLYKNTRYVLKNKVAFKVLESNLKNKKAIIEVSKL
ncbi:CNNM domain-containing protein [Mycoplasmopsis cynos]|uniref:CNNM domain-containing protein n=2 Tax=Mycoplasmopsis cynos TaxID=171284 RepID=A0A449AIX9_9BACT|nr:CNNM domain-containing protein [Mycoplasmopsis cynos]WAM05958.1 CNNM domain-containing protein [Mycoplasmopsis cynos]WQQ13220.1 CNNM domain-containing protein [Mycoplasmopsis cynos]WQQ13889.1 CNNM domain-containing protein [Mycoplasmopsis cynos]WQQ14758.1 CNNM domain-containing protein [Mycoplasmopsis cynos]WQQ19166.1 CNNM domain-containing protein [Mycoplasmopsis cynos]